MKISTVVVPLLFHGDRACRMVQRSAAWPGFMRYVIDEDCGPALSLDNVGYMRYDAVQLLRYTLWGAPPAAYLRRLLEVGVLAALVNLWDGCCPSLLLIIEMELVCFVFLLDPKTNRELKNVTRELAVP
mmetsp:Transcript_21245/g.56784  ORF Transcript_21245/g.56784 Transcript_21245/m.56784 type:complete len:129 (+) Transcript_21245:216-602(+)